MTTKKVYLNSQSVTLNTAERPMDRENRVRYKSRKDTIFYTFYRKREKAEISLRGILSYGKRKYP